MARKSVDAIAAVGNAPVTKAVGQVMQGMADVTQVASTVAGVFLGPEAKFALKAALNVIPDTGPSHIDQAANGVVGKIFG